MVGNRGIVDRALLDGLLKYSGRLYMPSGIKIKGIDMAAFMYNYHLWPNVPIADWEI